ncbi:Cytochrome P450 E-class group I protein [Dioscorea alata]|uniref:Cytochrome P450 E-class group I protein n=1 Tax=Dioscorea alata TaxID=55571 RepID=A0ACB7V5E9_DIOAL|nr:Cytochrome P450 E-class group I protein [Dioscorea alata]
MAPILLLFLLVTISLALLINQRERIRRRKLPPSPPRIPILGNLLWLTKPFSQLEPTLHHLRAKYGPIFTLYIGSRPVIFIMDGVLARRSLIQCGEVFADRPPPLSTSALNPNLHSINNTPYGHLWRLLRRNLISEVFHPLKSKKLSGHVQHMALDILLKRLKNEAEANGGVVVPVHSIQHCVSFFMTSLCFGMTLEEKVVNQIKNVQLELLAVLENHFVFGLLPKAALLLYWRRFGKLKQLRRAHEELLIPIIRARKQREKTTHDMISYVDSLLKLKVPVNGVGNVRELSEEDIVNFISEFLDASIWSSAASLEWIMANIVKYHDIQEKLRKEIRSVVGDTKRRIEEDEIQRMPYLKAVILEALRRHSPTHFSIPHSVKEDVIMDEYLIPKGTVVNYSVTSIGLDGRVWNDPLEFRPERFMAGGEGEGVDVNCGKRDIKMMPFGAGRRICPGSDMAVLLLQYLVANLVNEIELKAVEGMEIDLAANGEIFAAMKNPLRARIVNTA